MFIRVSNTTEVLTCLAAAVQNKRILPLLGCPGTGKSYLLEYAAEDYWQQEQGKYLALPRIVHIEMREPSRKGGGRYSTPHACIAFTELTVGLAHLSRTYDSELVYNTKLWYRQPRSQYTDPQFNSLFAFVRDECVRLQVSAILVDNAEHLDTFTVVRLMDLRRLLKHELALIFCAPITLTGTINEQLSRLLHVVMETDDVELAEELKPLREAETKGMVLIQILNQLNVDFSEELEVKDITAMRKMFWAETQGNWHVIARHQRRLKDFVGPNRGQMRFLTKDLFEKVMGKPLVYERNAE